MRTQRYNGRGKTGLGKWENGRRYLGRDEMGIQRYNGAREMEKREKVFGKG